MTTAVPTPERVGAALVCIMEVVPAGAAIDAEAVGVRPRPINARA